MKQTSIYRTIFHYISMNILSMMGLSLYILADTFFIANGVGSDGLVALNITLPSYALVNGVGLLLGIGGATVFSIAIGEGKQERCNQIFSQVLIIALIIGAFFSIVGLTLARPIGMLLGAKGEILPMTEMYLRTVIGFSVAFISNNVIVAFVRNDGSPKLSMAAMILGSASNIVLDYIFVFPMKMGMFGAALATGISPIISLCVLSMHFIKKHNTFHFIKTKLHLDDFKKVLYAGLPSFVMELSGGVVILVFNVVLLSISGNMAVAAYGIIVNVAMVCISIFTGIGQGIQPVVSRCHGAGDQSSVKKAVFCGGILSFLCGCLLYSIGYLFPEQIIRAFNQTADPVLAAMTLDGMKIYFTSFFFSGISIVLTAYFAAVTKPIPSLSISLLRGVGAVIPLALILPHFLGINGVWLTVPATEAITLLVGICFFLFDFRHSRQQKTK